MSDKVYRYWITREILRTEEWIVPVGDDANPGDLTVSDIMRLGKIVSREDSTEREDVLDWQFEEAQS